VTNLSISATEGGIAPLSRTCVSGDGSQYQGEQALVLIVTASFGSSFHHSSPDDSASLFLGGDGCSDLKALVSAGGGGGYFGGSAG
jgi:hypothetical protein